jgi:hypothetical protein
LENEPLLSDAVVYVLENAAVSQKKSTPPSISPRISSFDDLSSLLHLLVNLNSCRILFGQIRFDQIE